MSNQLVDCLWGFIHIVRLFRALVLGHNTLRPHSPRFFGMFTKDALVFMNGDKNPPMCVVLPPMCAVLTFIKE